MGCYASESQNIVSSRAAFPSTVYPWSRVAHETGAEVRLAPYDENHYTDPKDILGLIDNDTCSCYFTCRVCQRTEDSLREFSKAAHSVGALLIVDATQSMGTVPIDDSIRGRCHHILWLQVARGTYGTAVGYLSPDAKNPEYWF